MEHKTCNLDSCEVRDALGVIGGKWKNLIMYAVGANGTIRFNQLHKAVPGISQKMLTQQLRELERDGLINREFYQEIPPRVEYSATELGKTVGSVYAEVHAWQKENIDKILRAREKYDSKL